MEFLVDQFFDEFFFLFVIEFDAILLSQLIDDHAENFLDMSFPIVFVVLLEVIDDTSAVLAEAVEVVGVDFSLQERLEDAGTCLGVDEELKVFRIDFSHQQRIENINGDGFDVISFEMFSDFIGVSHDGVRLPDDPSKMLSENNVSDMQ